MMRIKAWVAAGCLLITGCDQVQNAADNTLTAAFHDAGMKQPGIILSPGLNIDDHGKKAVLYGDKICPESLMSSAVESGCIVIEPDDKTVAVRLSNAGEPLKKEVWTVEREGQHPKEVIRLKRPDGSYVMPWGNKAVIAKSPG
ncbi:hypothetical protein ACUTGP_25515 [Klebsiella pneumoniae]|uniref:hypothetical protein n=1 Tax=Klebsiella pneumoniae TaxID=573 RepID=UPI0028546603|nr:hypothetical protein [Salmonella enterica]